MNALPKATSMTYSPNKCMGLQDTAPCSTLAPFRHPALEEEADEETERGEREKEEEVKREDTPPPQIHPENP